MNLNTYSRFNKSNISREILILLAFVLIITLKCMVFPHFSGIIVTGSMYIQSILYILSSVLLILLPIFILFKSRSFYIMLLINIVLSVILIADIVYFRYYLTPLTLSLLYQVGLVEDTSESIFYLLNSWDFVLLADIPILIAGYIYLTAKGKKRIKTSFPKLKPLLIILVISLAVTFSLPIISRSNVISRNANYTIKKAGILMFHLQDAAASLSLRINKSTLSDNDITLLSSRLSKENPQNEYTGTAENMNLLIIQLEAFQEFAIGTLIDGEEITPHFNKLVKESLYFNNTYYQTAGGNTSDAEFIINTSLYPASKGAAYFLYSTNTYNSLASILKKEGYNAYSFHANVPNYWNIEVMYKTLDFDKYYSSYDFDIDEEIGWGLTDESFFRQSVEILKDKQPFYGFVIGLSSHHPYTAFKDYSFNTGELEGTYLGNYFKALHYTDDALGNMIEKLKSNGMYENTLTVIYGDHHGITLDSIDEVLDFLDRPKTPYEIIKLQKVPLLIHIPGSNNHKTIDKITSQIDIMPTILNLMGLESNYCLGNNILSDTEAFALLRSGTAITNEFIYYNRYNSMYSTVTGKKIVTSNYINQLEELYEELHLSDLINTKNAFSVYE